MLESTYKIQSIYYENSKIPTMHNSFKTLETITEHLSTIFSTRSPFCAFIYNQKIMIIKRISKLL